MLHSRRLLFLHYPKTAGKSASVYLCHNLDRPIHGIIAPAQHAEIGLGPEDGVHLDTGNGHQQLSVAARIMRDNGHDFDALELIVVVARNPYDLAVSKYQFLRHSYATQPAMRSRPNFAIAARNGFAEFCRLVRVPDFALYSQIDGRRPDNLRVLRFEDLRTGFRQVLEELGLPERVAMPHLNASQRADAREMIDPATKRVIDTRFAAIFDLAGYPREL